MELLQNSLNDILNRQIHPVELEIYRQILNFYSTGNDQLAELQLRTKIYTENIQHNNADQQAGDLFQKAVMESYSGNYIVDAANVFFSFQHIDTDASKKILANSINGISRAASDIAIPVISSNAKFSKNITHCNIIIGTTASKFLNKDYSSPLPRFIYLIKFENNEDDNDNFKLKILKECMIETMQLNSSLVFYSATNLAGCIAQYILFEKYNILIALQEIEIYKCTKQSFIAIVSEKDVKAVSNIVKKWNLHSHLIGKVSENKKCKISLSTTETIEITDSVIFRLIDKIAGRSKAKSLKKNIDVTNLPPAIEINKELAHNILTHPNLVSKRWIKEQFDRFIGNNNLSVNYHSDCPVYLSSNNKIGTFTTSTNPAFAKNILKGIVFSIFDDFRRTIATGADPLHCQINIPTNKNHHFNEIYENIAEITQKLGLTAKINSPANSLNSDSAPIYAISMFGILPDKKQPTEYNFKTKGDLIFLLGETQLSLCNEFIEDNNDEFVIIDEEHEIKRHLLMKNAIACLIENKLINSAHNISSYGLFHSLIKAAIPGRFGFDITTDSEFRTDVYLFSGRGGRILVSISPKDEDKFIDYLVDQKVPFTMLGHVTKEELRIDDISYGFIADVRKKYLKTFEQKMTN